jgi:hypothetical protein
VSPETLAGRVSQTRAGLTGVKNDGAEGDTTAGAMETVREPPEGVVEQEPEEPTAKHCVAEAQETPSNWLSEAVPFGLATWVHEVPSHCPM